MLPAHQRFEAVDGLVGDAQHRLVVQCQLLVVDGVAQVEFELAFDAKLFGHALWKNL